jgi:hypothetical protein
MAGIGTYNMSKDHREGWRREGRVLAEVEGWQGRREEEEEDRTNLSQDRYFWSASRLRRSWPTHSSHGSCFPLCGNGRLPLDSLPVSQDRNKKQTHSNHPYGRQRDEKGGGAGRNGISTDRRIQRSQSGRPPRSGPVG